MDGQHRPHPGDAGICRVQLATPDEPGGKPARPRTPRTGLHRTPRIHLHRAQHRHRRGHRLRPYFTRRPARTKAAAQRSSIPGCAQTRRRSTRCSTTRSGHGWNATGRSTRSSTRHGPDPGPSAGWPANSLAGNFRVTQRRSACHRTTSGSRSETHNAGLGTPSLIRPITRGLQMRWMRG